MSSIGRSRQHRLAVCVEARSPRAMATGQEDLAQLGIAQLHGLGFDLRIGATEGRARGVELAGRAEDVGAPAVDVLGALGPRAFELIDRVVEAGDRVAVTSQPG